MTPPIGFDPAAVLARHNGDEEHVGVTLWRHADGTLRLSIENEDEQVEQIALRPDFLEAFLAQARAREADAA